MKETPPIPAVGEPAPPVRPSYEQLGQRLTTMFESAGGKVTEAFPQFAPKGAMTRAVKQR
jgi:hypothetical protein